jgi:hypothetical protein
MRHFHTAPRSHFWVEKENATARQGAVQKRLTKGLRVIAVPTRHVLQGDLCGSALDRALPGDGAATRLSVGLAICSYSLPVSHITPLRI